MRHKVSFYQRLDYEIKNISSIRPVGITMKEPICLTIYP